MNLSFCESSENLVTRPLYILPQILFALSGIAATVILFYTVVKYKCRLLFHCNAKALMILFNVNCLIFAVDVALVSLMHLYNIMFHKQSCDLVYATGFCTIFRRTALTCLVGTTTTQLAQMIERIVATVMKENYGARTSLGGVLILFSILSALLTIEWTTWSEDYSELLTQCLTYSSSKSIGNRVFHVFYGMLVLDIIILISFLIMYKINVRRQIACTLPKKYQKHENVAVLRALYPVVILNTICVCTYISVAIIVRSFRDFLMESTYRLFALNFFIFPYISFFLAITVYLTSKKEWERRKVKMNAIGQLDSKASQHYFSQLAAQWGGSYNHHN